MPDSATLNYAAQVLANVSADHRADTALRFYFESHRYLQPPAKRVISHTVFVYFRWLGWLDPKASPQKRLEQSVALHERFTQDPKSVKPEALAALAVPAWIHPELDLPAATSDGSPASAAYFRQLQRDPALWLRAKPGTAAALAKSLADCQFPPPEVLSLEFGVLGSKQPTQDPKPKTQDLAAVRFTGLQDLFRTAQFKSGEFEIQDLASQLVGHACAPRPGETWWDTCAGEGGKTLHLADLMQNKGVVWSTDRNARRLDTLKRRAARAKLFNYRAALWDGSAKLPTKAKFDGILVDAPCSGVGTWQRNPHARWSTTPADVRELSAVQLALLNQVAGSLKPGGRLIYSVCTLTRSETTAVADAFDAAHPELEPLPLFERTTPDAARVFFWPHEIDANGMFIAGWRRKA